ncbi:facilitated trehalose transporter Tret1-2 homolog [Macrosteles quadrilineatus]|uniref:facilitated trehalose transporter Tret1-2 homolog n=1 Tax=Macrosteles quadrilineatus TaxID=74068 RepID=UPI0023E2648A|nr:facilitated trehalose transporter Tret1-2 homolog [Macrosteles quadrilineatus]XP_054270582.1 facilitated trehalose transporter Tret1-2 homolog [Macrosteles quadrilineatus]XP_054270583.1 facilitated trehalose transporter Tret1-2 homolog [Macrosteles quadrilineatus]XP_054270584.1 facilitated trehalose transporter Tret1-2 homolog [Macrosteles quadrilineatus]
MTLVPSTPSEKATLRQYLAAITVTLGMMVVGETFGWPSPTLPRLEDPSAPLHLDHSQMAWVVSLLYMGNLLSPIPTGWLMDRFGRKRSLILLSVLPLSSWTLILLAKRPLHLYIARLLAGFWIGVVTTIAPIYIGEIAEPRIRGALGNFSSLMTYVGDLFIYLVGPYVSYSTLALVAGSVPVIFLLTFSWMPESPYYFLMQGKKDEARESLRWLRGDAGKGELETEINKMEENVKSQMQNKGTMMDIFATHANRKAFFIVEVLAVCVKFSGTGVMMAFASTTLPKDAFSSFGPSECVIVLGITWVSSAILSMQLVDRLGRKVLLSVSSFGCGCAVLLAGVWFYLDSATSVNVRGVSWVPFTCFLLHALLYSLGLGPIGMAIKGEVLAANIKANASAITSIVLALSALFLNRVYLFLADSIGMYVNYWMFAAACFIACGFTLLVVVETKGKTLQEIQDELARRKPQPQVEDGL